MRHPNIKEVLAETPRRAGLEVRHARKERGLSQAEVADRMQRLGFESWHQTTVSKTENQQSDRALTFQELLGLAVCLELPNIDRFVGFNMSRILVGNHALSSIGGGAFGGPR